MESAAPELAAGPHGLVCAVCYRTIQQHPSGDFVGQAVAVCSTDGGHSFAAPVPLGSGVSKIQLPGQVRPNCSPTVAVSSNGYLYAAFVKHQPGARHSDIVVNESSDGGRTWPKAVTATPADGVIYFQPNLAVNSEGRVAVSAFALANGRVNQVPARLAAGGASLPSTAACDYHRVQPAQPYRPRQAWSMVDRRLPGHHRRGGW
jgi:hypothetical protein